jgi:hypothetical protein
MAIFYSPRFETLPTWRARSPYLYPPGTRWPSYTPKHWIPFSSPPTTRRTTVDVFDPASTRETVWTLVSVGRSVGRLVRRSVGWSFGLYVKLLLTSPAQSLMASVPSRSMTKISLLFLTGKCFQMGHLLRRGEGSVFQCRRYVCYTLVSARVYPRCHGVQVSMDSVHPLSLHHTKYWIYRDLLSVQACGSLSPHN